MRRLLIAVSAVLLVLVTVLGGGAVLSSSESGDINQQPLITAEVGGNGTHLREASAALRSAGLGSLGVPLAGIYVNEGTATIHVGLTEIADEYTAPIEAIVEQVEGVNVEFFQARFTLPELAGLKAQVEGSFLRICSPAEQGVPLVCTGVDIRNNGLVVFLREIRPEYVAAIRDVVGDEVPIEFLEEQLELH